MQNNLFRPDWQTESIISKVSLNDICNRDLKGLLIDVDHTLLTRDESIVHESVREWIESAKSYFKLHLISNNPSYKRVNSVAKQLNVGFSHKALKPRKSSLLEMVKLFKLKNHEVAMIGDRIFTDILAGNRAGMYTILVKGIGINGSLHRNNVNQHIESIIAKLLGA